MEGLVPGDFASKSNVSDLENGSKCGNILEYFQVQFTIWLAVQKVQSKDTFQ